MGLGDLVANIGLMNLNQRGDLGLYHQQMSYDMALREYEMRKQAEREAAIAARRKKARAKGYRPSSLT